MEKVKIDVKDNKIDVTIDEKTFVISTDLSKFSVTFLYDKEEVYDTTNNDKLIEALNSGVIDVK